MRLVNDGYLLDPANRPAKLSEHQAQALVIEWADWMVGQCPGLKWLFAVPNGAKLPYGKNKRGGRYAPQAVKLLKEGLRPGVSDLFLPIACHGFHGLFIEMKVGNNKPTETQLLFLRDMNEQGYLAVVCWGPDQAILTIKCYLGMD